MAYGLHCLAVLLLYLCLQCNQGTARPLPEYIGLGLSEQSDWKILSPSSFIVDAASALGKSTTKQTDDQQDRDSVLTFEEASGYSGHIKGGEKRLEQALWAEFLDSSSGASSQSDIEIVDIEGSGEIEDDAAASYTEMTDAFYRDETAHVISESVPTTREPKTQISPPASWSAIKDYVDSSASGDGSDLDTDDLDENTPTVAETQVTFQGATVLDRQDVPAEGNSTIPVPGA
ncbi:hypothetical protein AALO_G00298550 [Alosa alosa]|uniref:Male reproductive-related protein n=1 Tax=Alosa alosa TaxID=278164 RepID=A0AAV6FGP9_9TELE|nr:hypothetical protein AALO_G00298550 [Alosa alosa]